MAAGYRPEIIQSAFVNFIGSHLNPFWSLTTPRVRLIAKHSLNEELVALEFQTNQAFRRQAFKVNSDWHGGQYISLMVPIAGIYHQRNYSLIGLSEQPLALTNSISKSFASARTNVNNTSHTLTIAIKPQGMVSNYLTKQARIGAIFDTSVPSGEFTLAHLQSKLNEKCVEPSSLTEVPLLFIASGSGITPMLGLITQALHQGYQVTLLYYHRGTLADTPFLSYWQSLSKRYADFNYHIVSTNEPSSYLADSRYLTADSLLALELPLANTYIFACGSQSLLASLYQAANEIKLPDDNLLIERIIIEKFGSSPATFDQQLEVDTANNEPQKITLRNRQQQFTTNKTLLLGAEQAGIKLPFGCRQGICQLCRCQKISGVVKNTQTGKVSSNGYESIQTCINVAMTEVILEP